MIHAKCHCGNLQATCPDEPDRVIMCHCGLCQRRTGSAFHLAAWFERDAVQISGAYATYSRNGELGNRFDWHFCPTCGTTLWWEATQLNPGQCAVAVGCFNDPSFRAPDRSLFGANRHHWVNEPENTISLIGNIDSTQS